MNKKQLAELQSQIDLEKQKCANDLNYFINKYIKVVHPVRGVVPFELDKFQQDIIGKYQEQRFNFIKTNPLLSR